VKLTKPGVNLTFTEIVEMKVVIATIRVCFFVDNNAMERITAV
jgi:hypothetical protein